MSTYCHNAYENTSGKVCGYVWIGMQRTPLTFANGVQMLLLATYFVEVSGLKRRIRLGFEENDNSS